MIRKRLLAATALCASLAPAALAQEALPDIEVGAPLRARSAPAAPAPGPASAPAAAPASAPAPALSTAPASVIITTAREIADTRQFDIGGALERSTPGVSTNDVLGNPFSRRSIFAASSPRRFRERPRASPSIRTACASTKPMAIRSIGT